MGKQVSICKSIYGVRFFLVLMSCLFLCLPFCSFAESVRYAYTLKNTANHMIPHIDVWTYTPLQHAFHQQAQNGTSTPTGNLISDPFGNQILHITVSNLAPYASAIVRVQSEVNFADTPLSSSSNELSIYLKSQPYIESDDPRIEKLATSLYKHTSQDTIDAICTWISENMSYAGWYGQDLGALWALKNKKGDCTELSYLFTALCRANQIPARVMGGYLYKGDGRLIPALYHNWVEYYDGNQWQRIDPQLLTEEGRRTMPEGMDYIAMRILPDKLRAGIPDFHRFFYKGDHIEVFMSK